MRIDIYHHFPKGTSTIETKLDNILALLGVIKQKEEAMATSFERLAEDVQGITDGVTAVEATIGGLVQQIKDLAAVGGTPAQFAELADRLEAAKSRLAAAAIAGTSSDPTITA